MGCGWLTTASTSSRLRSGTDGEWEAALIHSLDTWPGYSVNDRVQGDAVWFEVCGEAREPYRRSWIEKREWSEEELKKAS